MPLITNQSQKTLSTILFSLVLIFIQGSSVAQETSSDLWRVSPRKAKIKNPVLADASSLTAGKDLYLRECQQCHGESGKGDGPVAAALGNRVANLTSSKVLEQSDGAIYTKIRTGRSPMPSFKSHLSKEEIWHLINFIRKDLNATIKLSEAQ